MGKGLGLQEAGKAEGMPESLMLNTSTDQQGLGQGGRPGGRGCLPPRLLAGGPGHRAGHVHICGSPGDPGCLPRLPRPALAAPAAPTVNQRLVAESVLGQNGESGWMWQRWHPALGLSWTAPCPSRPLQREIKPQKLLQSNLCQSVRGGRWGSGPLRGCPQSAPGHLRAGQGRRRGAQGFQVAECSLCN